MRKLVYLIPLLLILLFILPIVFWVFWSSSLPPWELSAKNSPEGVIIEVYQAGETAPTYTAVLPDQTLTMEVSRVMRTELPAELGETTFYDETTKPGRWTLLINDTKIDIMERAMIIDGKTSIAPAEER